MNGPYVDVNNGKNYFLRRRVMENFNIAVLITPDIFEHSVIRLLGSELEVDSGKEDDPEKADDIPEIEGAKV